MKIKPAKSYSQSIRKGARNDHISFSFDEEKILLLAEQPVQSPGRLYSADLSDKHVVDSVMTQFSEGLVKTDQSQLPRKTWCYQFTLYHCLMWALKLCEILAPTSLWPDIVLWPVPAKTVITAGLTEKRLEEAFGMKKKNSELAAGQKTHTYPVEVGCRGIVGKSTPHLLKTLEVA